jgi:membrane dipeptidase
MDRRQALAALAALPLVSTASSTPAAAAPRQRPFPVVDLNVGLPYRVAYGNYKLERGSGRYRASHFAKAGVIGVVMQLQFPPGGYPVGPDQRAMEFAYRKTMEAIRASSVYAEPYAAPAQGQVRTWLSLQGATPFAKHPEAIPLWVAGGIRMFGLVHRYDNAIVSSSGKRPQSKTGLTDRGREVVERIWRAGALVDISHTSDPGAEQVIAMAKQAGKPVVASHSNARVFSPHMRNLSDPLLRAVADTGGVVGLTFHTTFFQAGRVTSIKDAVMHAHHMIEVMGVEHLAIGSDFESNIRPPRDLNDIDAFPRLAQALLDSGLSETDVEKVFSRNALRVLQS